MYFNFGLRQTTPAAGQAAAQSTAASRAGQGRCPGGWPAQRLWQQQLLRQCGGTSAEALPCSAEMAAECGPS